MGRDLAGISNMTNLVAFMLSHALFLAVVSSHMRFRGLLKFTCPYTAPQFYHLPGGGADFEATVAIFLSSLVCQCWQRHMSIA
jgi:hypothetical protein